MRAKTLKRSNQGFTLVELLIVVAIAGVLAVVGIPQFRRMLVKSRKAEAKQALGALYAANSAFFSEYNAYGSNLRAIGFEMDAGKGGRRYTIGFPIDNTCAVGNGMPSGTNTFANNLNQVYPAYYTNITDQTTQVDFAEDIDGNKLEVCEVASVPADGQSYLATATGYIRPFDAVITNLADATIDLTDVWTIDQNRLLSNTQDGVP